MGLDWGFFPSPFVLEIGIRCGAVWLNVDETYETRLGAPDILKALAVKQAQYRAVRIWADPEEQTSVSFLQSHGFPVIPNLTRDVVYGQRVVYGLLKQRVNHPELGPGPRLRFDKARCPNVVDEFGEYRVPEVRGEFKGGPVGRRHGLDAVRYYLTGEGEIPPEEKVLGPLERPKMWMDEFGRWHDDPIATMMQRALLDAVDPNDWTGEGGVELDPRFETPEDL
jgi:hypothetical protein